MNTPVDYSSRYSFGQFCCRVKQGKRLSEFLQKYPDSGTETTHLAGYNILVYKYVKITAGLPLLFIGTIIFFEILACFICLKRLLLRTLDVNITKLYNI